MPSAAVAGHHISFLYGGVSSGAFSTLTKAATEVLSREGITVSETQYDIESSVIIEHATRIVSAGTYSFTTTVATYVTFTDCSCPESTLVPFTIYHVETPTSSGPVSPSAAARAGSGYSGVSEVDAGTSTGVTVATATGVIGEVSASSGAAVTQAGALHTTLASPQSEIMQEPSSVSEFALSTPSSYTGELLDHYTGGSSRISPAFWKVACVLLAAMLLG